MTPQQLTALNLDKTSLLEEVLGKHFGRNPDDLLGELQFSFLAFLMGQSLEGALLLLFVIVLVHQKCTCPSFCCVQISAALLQLAASDLVLLFFIVLCQMS